MVNVQYSTKNLESHEYLTNTLSVYLVKKFPEQFKLKQFLNFFQPFVTSPPFLILTEVIAIGDIKFGTRLLSMEKERKVDKVV
jgi:hypothetical protein